MQTTPHDAVAGSRRALDRTDPDDLRYNLRISVWVRWFLLIAWLVQFNYRPNFGDPAYIPTTLLAVSLLALNGYVHYRIRSNRTVTRRWALALSTMDAAMITAGIAISASGFQNTFFVLYYPALAKRNRRVGGKGRRCGRRRYSIYWPVECQANLSHKMGSPPPHFTKLAVR